MKNQKGFTMIEMLIAISILSIVLLGLCHLGYATLNATVKAKTLSVANAISQEKMEALKTVPYKDLSSSTTPETVTVNGVVFTRSWTVPTPASGENSKTITLTTTWTHPKPSSLTMTSYVGEK